MAKAPPWYCWFPADYMAGSQHLSPDARLVYRELLDAQWMRGGGLPNVPVELRRIARLDVWSLRRFRGAMDEIQADHDPKFTLRDGLLVNERMEREREKAERYAEGGRKGSLSRWGCPACRRAGKPNPERFSGHEHTCPDCGEPV